MEKEAGLLSECIENLYPVKIHFAEILGNRWKFVAGNTIDQNKMFDYQRFEINSESGIIIYGISLLNERVQQEIINMFGLICYENTDELKKSLLFFLSSPLSALLIAFADKIRQLYCGNEIHLRGLIEFSNYCVCNCRYCGIRKDNDKIQRYRLEDEQIIEIARQAVGFSCKTVVLQSGEDYSYTTERICGLISRIKKETNCAITLSLGQRSFSDYEKMFNAGADRYLLRFETSNQDLFKSLRPGSDPARRLQCLRDLKKAGFQVGSGCMVGLPGQSLEDLVNDILLMLALDLDMIGIGPFIANPETPLKDCEKGTLTMMQKFISLVRIITKNTHIPATTAVGSIDPLGRHKILQCGANVIMPNLTPQQYREHYRLYPDKICVYEQPGDCHGCVEKIAEGLGRTISKGYGHSLKNRT